MGRRDGRENCRWNIEKKTEKRKNPPHPSEKGQHREHSMTINAGMDLVKGEFTVSRNRNQLQPL